MRQDRAGLCRVLSRCRRSWVPGSASQPWNDGGRVMPSPPALKDPAWAFAHCEAQVREGDPDRYFATLFAPADKRPFLLALYAFSREVARVRETVSEALPGEIRLQWWRDTLQGEARGDVRANPIAAALEETVVRFRLPRQALVDLIDARTFDLYDDPMPTLADLEG